MRRAGFEITQGFERYILALIGQAGYRSDPGKPSL
jgi:hypothetical protein